MRLKLGSGKKSNNKFLCVLPMNDICIPISSDLHAMAYMNNYIANSSYLRRRQSIYRPKIAFDF